MENSKQVAAEVVLATFSTQLRSEQTLDQQRSAAVTSLYYMPYMTIPNLLKGYAAYNDVVRQVGEETGATVIGGENAIPADTRNFVDSVHFTTLGSRVMSERVALGLLQSEDLRRFLSED